MLGGGRIDVSAGGEDEWDPRLGQPVGDGPDMLAALQVNVQDRDFEAALLDLLHRVCDGVGSSDDLVAKRVEEILEHHRDQRFVFGDQDGAALGHAAPITA